MEASFWRGLAGAVAIHVGTGALLLFAAPTPWLAARVSQRQLVWIELDSSSPSLDVVKPEPAAPSTANAPSETSPHEATERETSLHRPNAAAPVAIGSAGAVLTDGTSGPDGIGAPEGAASANSSEAASGNGPPNGVPGRRRRPIDIGLGDGLHWATVGPVPTSTVPRSLSTTGALQEALDQHDRAMGLGFGGPAVSAVRSAVSNPTAPRVGLATIEFVFDGMGKVQSARVLSANNDAAGWARVAADARAALAAGRVRVPAQSAGLAITLQVEARTQLPSGAKPGDAVNVHPNGLGAGAEFDLSDIGATPTRNVSVRIVGERRL